MQISSRAPALARFPAALRLWLLIAALGIGSTGQAAPAKGTVTGEWSLIEGDPGDGVPKCMLFGRGDQSTIVQLMTDARHHGAIALGAVNLKWSIKKGDDLGEISFSAAGGKLTGAPVASDHAFFYFIEAPDVVAFFRTAGGQVSIEWNGDTIARFPTGNLPSMLAEFQDCGEKLHARDPFVRRIDRPSPQESTSDLTADEAVAIPPRPIDLGRWVGAIQKDYFAGPHYEGDGTKLQHEQRNSRPASVKFRITVDRLGKMVNCEVLESSGYNEWGWLFCSLAKQHPLKFTPAVSASGEPVSGEYITTAKVAFE